MSDSLILVDKDTMWNCYIFQWSYLNFQTGRDCWSSCSCGCVSYVCIKHYHDIMWSECSWWFVTEVLKYYYSSSLSYVALRPMNKEVEPWNDHINSMHWSLFSMWWGLGKDHLHPLIPAIFPKWWRTTYGPEKQAKLCSSQLKSFQAKSRIGIAAVELAS